MNIITDVRTSPTMNLNLDPEPVEEIPTEPITEFQRNRQVDVHDWENNPATAHWGPLMQEVCGLWSIPAVSIEC
jgi:hypothetical protein